MASDNWALILALFSLGISFWVATTKYWELKRRSVLDPWTTLVSKDIASARAIVGRAARAEAMSPKEHDEFTDAAFRLLWALQRVDVATATVKKTAIGTVEAKWLYRQIESIHPDLQDAISKHGASVDWQPSLKYTNSVLVSLPREVKNSWGRVVLEKTFGEIRAPRRSLTGTPYDSPRSREETPPAE